MNRILCIEDSEDTILILGTALDRHQVVFARTIQEAMGYIKQELFSLLIVDIDLPDGSGFEFIADLPLAMKDSAVLFLTGKQDFTSKASAFSLGADDYITKPFDPRDLRLRVDARLKKIMNGHQDEISFSVGDLICYPQEQRLVQKGHAKSIPLTSLEFRIFRTLTRQTQKIFSRDEILNRVWSDSIAVTDRTVDVHVSNLRRKLSGSSVEIETVFGAGYRIKIKTTTQTAPPNTGTGTDS